MFGVGTLLTGPTVRDHQHARDAAIVRYANRNYANKFWRLHPLAKEVFADLVKHERGRLPDDDLAAAFEFHAASVAGAARHREIPGVSRLRGILVGCVPLLTVSPIEGISAAETLQQPADSVCE
jgi:hypothetical protein